MKAKFLMSPAFATFLICVPLRPIPATAQPYAYVADSNSASVKVIDTKTVSTVATVSSGLFRELQFVAITPDGAYAYITDRNAGAVMVIDTTLASTTPNSAVVATVPVGKLPEGVAITPDGAYAYVANGGSSTISVIDTAKALTDASHAIVATVLLSTGSTPLGVAITPDGSRAYVTDTSSNQVLVIDTKRALTSPATGVVAVVTLLVNSLVQPLPAYPALVAIAPDGQRVYVTLNNSDSLAVIDTASQMQQYFGGSTICLDFQSGTCEFSGFPVKVGSPSWSSALAVSPDGSRVYVAFHTDRSTDPARSPNRMSVVQVATLQATNTIPVGGVPTVAAITPDGAQLYVTNQGDGTVSLINTAAAIAVSTPIDTGLHSFPFGIAIQGDFTAGAFVGLGSAAVVGVPVRLGITIPQGFVVSSAEWDFLGNGSVVQTTSGLSTQYVYSQAGVYHPTVTLFSAQGQTLLRQTIPVRVQSQGEAVAFAAGLVTLLPSADRGSQQSLLSKLNAAAATLSRSDSSPNAACGPMQAFVNEVNALIATQRLTGDAATPVLGQSKAVQLSLGCNANASGKR